MTDNTTPENTDPEVVVDDDKVSTSEVNEEETPQEPTQPEPKKEEEPKEPETPEEEPEVPEEEDGFDYTEYDHPALKQVVTILRSAKIPTEEANAIFAAAVAEGDVSKVDRAALVEKLGQDQADVVMVLAEAFYNGQFQKMKTLEQAGYDLVGGKEIYDDMRTWAQEKEKTDPAFAKELNAIRELANTNREISVKAAVQELFELYKTDPDTTIPADLVTGDKPGSSAGVSPLTRLEYGKLLEQASRDGSYDKVSKQLWKRRQAGMKQGI